MVPLPLQSYQGSQDPYISWEFPEEFMLVVHFLSLPTPVDWISVKIGTTAAQEFVPGNEEIFCARDQSYNMGSSQQQSCETRNKTDASIGIATFIDCRCLYLLSEWMPILFIVTALVSSIWSSKQKNLAMRSKLARNSVVRLGRVDSIGSISNDSKVTCQITTIYPHYILQTWPMFLQCFLAWGKDLSI